MSERRNGTLEDRWNAFSKLNGIPTKKVVSQNYEGKDTIYVEAGLGQISNAIDAERELRIALRDYDLQLLEILEAEVSTGRMFIGWNT